MKIDVFLSSNMAEFSKEREYIYDNIKQDDTLNDYFSIYLFEEDNAKSTPSSKVFIEQVEKSDIYIGLIGENYGNIYREGVSATEYEYNLFNKTKSDAFFYIKNTNEMDENSQKFFNRIKKYHKYKKFSSKEELLIEIKKSLKDYIIFKSKNNIFESTLIPESTFEDVDEMALKLFYDSLKDSNIKKIIGVRSDDKILEYIGAGTIDSKGIFHLNNAGALFFAKNITKFGLDFEVKMVRFKGNDRRKIIDQKTTNSPFFVLIEEFEKFFEKNTKIGTYVKDMKGYSIPEYPLATVREAFINAICHRDYNLRGDAIIFYIYDDRILISSPGGLPYPLTIDDLLVEVNPKHRNKCICDIMKKTEYMEHVGTGITRMKLEMLESGLDEPEFYNGNYFKVILRGPNGELIVTEKHIGEKVIDLSDFNLNKRQIKALTSMNNENLIYTYNSYSDEFDVSLTTSKRDLEDLIDKGLVIKHNNSKIKKFSSVNNIKI